MLRVARVYHRLLVDGLPGRTRPVVWERDDEAELTHLANVWRFCYPTASIIIEHVRVTEEIIGITTIWKRLLP